MHEVAPGYMRNLLKPRNLAEYVKKAKQNRSASTVIVRPLFMLHGRQNPANTIPAGHANACRRL